MLPKNLIARSIGIAVLITHIWRMVYCERMLAGAHDTCAMSMEVLEHLPLHGVALPVVRDSNWLHEHLSAFTAARYEGVFFSPWDHAFFEHQAGESWQIRDYIDGYQLELRWLEEHVSKRSAPVIDHIVLFGHGKAPDGRLNNVLNVLERHYIKQWENGYAEEWALKEQPPAISTARNRACCRIPFAAPARPHRATPLPDRSSA